MTEQIEKTEPKKGRRTWRPATQLDVTHKEKGFRYRWLDTDPANIDKKKREGWEVVSGVQGKQAEEHVSQTGNTGMTSLVQYRELTLGRLPEDIAKERDEYFNGLTNARTAALKENVRHNLRQVGGDKAAAALTGKITIIE